MPLLNKRTLVANDAWQVSDSEQPVELMPNTALTFEQFLQLRETDPAKVALVKAIVVSGVNDHRAVLAAAHQFDLIMVEFPVLRDGRGFSLARWLRADGFSGEIRAIGETSRDKLALLERCGFDSVALEDAMFKPEYLNAYTEISVRYQGSADDNRPIYKQ